MNKTPTYLTVFLAGAAIMILEISGARLLAPHLGMSITVWTSVIGVVMSSLTLGYYFGGKQADKRDPEILLPRLLLLAGVFTLLTGTLYEPTLTKLSNVVESLTTCSILSVCILFAPASVLLASITPLSIKLASTKGDAIGSVAGVISALSALGSICGTFTAGLFLAGTFRSDHIIIGTGTILVLLAIFFKFGSGDARNKVLGLVLFAALLNLYQILPKDQTIIADVETRYTRIIVKERTINHRRQRLLITDPFVYQSALYLDPPPAPVDRFSEIEERFRSKGEDLVLPYTKYFRIAEYLGPKLRHVLMIGGGAMVVPRDFLVRNPEAAMDVVEIDSGLSKIAREQFEYRDDQRIHLINEDGRRFLNKSKGKKYDAVFLDAYGSGLAAPFQLTTQEAFSQIASLLAPGGVVVVNTYSAISGEEGTFYQALANTMHSVFKEIFIFAVRSPQAPDVIQNVITVGCTTSCREALAQNSQELEQFRLHLFHHSSSFNAPIMTDLFAPVESYTAPIAPALWKIKRESRS